MDSSPTTSPSTSRFFSTFPSGPPKRTYAKNRGAVAQTRTRSSVSKVLEQNEEDDTSVPSSSQRRATRNTSPRSSPTPISRRSSSRLAPSSSQARTSPVKGSSSSSQLTELPDIDEPESSQWEGETVAERRSSSRRNDSSKDGQRQKETSSKTLKADTKRKREDDLASIVSVSPRRSTRNRTHSAASIPSEEVDRPKTPPPKSSESTAESSSHQMPSTPPRSVRPALPTTPTSSSPRDFARLFAAVSPGGTSLASPRAARILGKSQSSGSVLDSPSKLRQRFESVHRQESFGSSMSAGPSTPSKRLGKTQSMPVTPSQASPIMADPDPSPDPSAILVQPSVPEGQGSGGRAKRVYGRNRTVVAEQEEESQEAPTLEETLNKESYADLRKRYEVDSGSADVSADLLSGALAARPPESVNDMRSKGGNRRYMDETGYLLDGIIDEGASKGFKKSSCVDLLANMLQDEWLAKMKICGQTERVWAALSHARGTGDDVMYAVCLLALYIVVLSGDGIEAIVRSDANNVVGLLLEELDQRNGVLDPDSKIKQTAIVIRVREISQEISLRISRSVTSRGVAAAIWAAICQRPTLSQALETLESTRAVIKMSQVVVAEAKPLESRFKLYESGLDLLPSDGSLDIYRLADGLSVLKALLLSIESGREDLTRHELGLATAIHQSLVAAVALALQPESPSASIAVSVIEHTLKISAIMLDHTRKTGTWIASLLTTRGTLTALGRLIRYRESLPPSAEQNRQDAGVGERAIPIGQELLTIAVGNLTAATDVGTSFAGGLAMLYLAPGCLNRAECLRLCFCVNAESFAFYLVELYTEFIQGGLAPGKAMVGAYLALLLTKIILSESPHTDNIISKLPGDTRTEKLQGLSTSLDEMEEYQIILRSEHGDVEDEEEVEEEEDEENWSVTRKAKAELELLI